jgi:hypothetical protein
MPVTDISLSALSTPVVPSNIPPALQTRVDRINGVRPGAIPQPVLRFTDLISGPATGLGDGLGSGVIVTVWGQGFGEATGTVWYTDSLGVERPAAHVYYWKKADGTLPGGPADLWTSHLMYEVAFSVPAGSADGLGSIRIRKAGWAATVYDGYSLNNMPFTVRTGRILWVAPTGNNSNAGTSFAAPKLYINGGGNPSSLGMGNYLQAGDTVYSRGVIEVPETPTARDAMYIRGAAGTLSQQIMICAYPGTRPEVHGYEFGVHIYNSRAVGVSKFKVMTGNQPPAPPGELVPGVGCTHLVSCQEGRFVGIELTDNPNTCTTGQSAAIMSNYYGMDGTKYFGCNIHNVGCDGTSHYQHTMYLSARALVTVNAPEIAFMHLRDCKAKFGIHIYDQADQYGDSSTLIGTAKIHDNVIVRQKGAGISCHSANAWTAGLHIYNNVLIECGKGPVAEVANGTSAEAMYLGIGWLPAECRIEDNLIYKYSDASSRIYSPAAAAYIDYRSSIADYRITRNVIVSDGNFAVFRFAGTNTAVPTNSDKNAFISLDPANSNSLPAGWTNSILNTALKMSLYDSLPDVQLTSPLNSAGSYSRLSNYDIYGRARANTLGPVEAV